jgi:hypothetical protein
MPEVRVDGEVARVLALGVLVLEEIGPAAGDGDRAIDEACARARARDAAAREAFRAPARALYRAFGIDPTKHRPSSEQLAHRVGDHASFDSAALRAASLRMIGARCAGSARPRGSEAPSILSERTSPEGRRRESKDERRVVRGAP